MAFSLLPTTLNKALDDLQALRQAYIRRCAELESIRKQLAECQKALNAAKQIIKSKEHRQLDEVVVQEARDSLESERQANEQLTKELAESQAREAKLRDFVDVCIELDDYLTETTVQALEVVRDLPSDDTALQEERKQAKKEALLEAADWWDQDDNLIPRAHSQARKEFRRRAEEQT